MFSFTFPWAWVSLVCGTACFCFSITHAWIQWILPPDPSKPWRYRQSQSVLLSRDFSSPLSLIYFLLFFILSLPGWFFTHQKATGASIAVTFLPCNLSIVLPAPYSPFVLTILVHVSSSACFFSNTMSPVPFFHLYVCTYLTAMSYELRCPAHYIFFVS